MTNKTEKIKRRKGERDYENSAKFIFDTLNAFFANGDLETIDITTTFASVSLKRKTDNRGSAYAVGFSFPEDEDAEDVGEYCKKLK